MKRCLIIILISSLNFLHADPWDNLSHDEAKKVTEYLKVYPYILDYCDCCAFQDDYPEVVLIQVKSASIEPCSWDQGKYTVEIDGVSLLRIPFNSNGLELNNPQEIMQGTKFTFTMNYTWGWNKQERKCMPFYKILTYDYEYQGDPCESYTSFPSPKDASGKVIDKGYAKWFKSNVRPTISKD